MFVYFLFVRMSSQVTVPSLRDELFAGEHVWIDEIDTLLQNLDASVLNDGSWAVNDGVYIEGEGYSTTSEKYPSYSPRKQDPSSSLQFSYAKKHPSTKWFDCTGHFSVKYKKLDKGGRRCTETNQYGPRENGPSGFENTVDLDQKMYVIDGYLVDSLTTPSVEKAAEHVADQLEKVEERIKFNLDIETADRIATKINRPNTDINNIADINDITDFRVLSPFITVSGIGEKSAERIAQHFGLYSNILQYSPAEIDQHDLSEYKYDPDTDDEIYEKVNRAVSMYFELQDAGKTRSSLTPEDVINYPNRSQDGLASNGCNHNNEYEPESPLGKNLTIPLGCESSTVNVTKTKQGIHGSATLYSRSDGFWEINNHANGSLIVAMGTEAYEVYMLAKEYERNQDSQYQFPNKNRFTGDAVDILSDIDDIRRGNTIKKEVATNSQLVSNVQAFIPGRTEWRPSLLNSYCTDGEKPHISYLMSCTPETFLDDTWDYSQNNSGLEISYTTNSELTNWNQAINTISISFENGTYVVSDLFNDDETFYGTSKVLNEIADRMDHIEMVVTGNQFVEQIHTIRTNKECTNKACNMPGYSEILQANPTEILDDINGISSLLTNSIAEEYKTYLNLARTNDDLSEYKNHHFENEATFISDYTRRFTNTYKRTDVPLESDIPNSYEMYI